jgi:hypothetical protein
MLFVYSYIHHHHHLLLHHHRTRALAANQPFQQSIESLFELAMQNGVHESQWPEFIESRVASWRDSA